MQITVNREKHTAEVWLTIDERDHPLVQEKLSAFYQSCRAQKLSVAVYQSGDASLDDTTRELLCYHYNYGMLSSD